MRLPSNPPTTAPTPVPTNRFLSLTGLVWVTCSSWHSWRGVLTVLVNSLALTTCALAGVAVIRYPATAPIAPADTAPITNPTAKDLFTSYSPVSSGKHRRKGSVVRLYCNHAFHKNQRRPARENNVVRLWRLSPTRSACVQLRIGTK